MRCARCGRESMATVEVLGSVSVVEHRRGGDETVSEERVRLSLCCECAAKPMTLAEMRRLGRCGS